MYQIIVIFSNPSFNPKIFTDITTPVKQFYSPHTGKIYVVCEKWAGSGLTLPI
jgi:hypothetical protein